MSKSSSEPMNQNKQQKPLTKEEVDALLKEIDEELSKQKSKRQC
ncbi:hypothetical protein [Litoribacterium kuwaitense]|nr:hypothetical protein [Litoribacterium kuwaitense]